jgi:hypothetical protein
MSNNELFEYLFALRISLQDSYENESDIIRELKYYLRDINTPSTQINQTLHDFYNLYGINISVETIDQVPTMTTNVLSNILGYILGSNNSNDNIDNNINDNSDDNSDDNNNDNSDDNNNDNSDDNSDDNSNINNDNSNINNDNNNIQAINNFTNSILEFLSNDQPTDELYNQPINNNIYTFQNPQLIQSLLQYNSNNLSQNSMITLFNSFVNNDNNIFSDVVITTDEHDLKALKTYKLEDDSDINCSICMENMKKDETILKLNCSHTFHNDCIKQYLEKYNYKCPICRDEVGKPKYNI